MSTTTSPRPTNGLQWRTILMGLPNERFTREQLQRALPQGVSRSLSWSLAVNVLVPSVLSLVYMAYHAQWALVFAGAIFTAGMLIAAWRAWRDPSDAWARRLYYGVPMAAGVWVGLMSSTIQRADVALHRPSLGLLVVLMVSGTYGLWFLIAYRHQRVQLRLRELDEHARAVAMAQQLAQAQIRPHFLFNSLAALQHWVHSKDDRAAPMLDALTAFLRATLPMFDRTSIRLGDEEAAVRRYLEVMRHRWGERLSYSLQVSAAAREWQVPPGVVLTLVENAIEHGIGPQLAGGRIELRAHAQDHAQGQQAVIEVQDDGVGVHTASHKAHGGVGLSNSRARLVQAFGPAATLELRPPTQGGCLARITWPLPSSPTPISTSTFTA
jgi:hypothetical protein